MFSRKQPVAVEALAQTLAESEAHREQVIALAHQDHAAVRADVIAQGTQRAQELRKLEAEAAAEAAKAEALVAKA